MLIFFLCVVEIGMSQDVFWIAITQLRIVDMKVLDQPRRCLSYINVNLRPRT